MKAIQESARIASRGEQGLVGPRGIPGPPSNILGPRGEKGDPASRPIGFVVNPEDFSASLVMSDGSPSGAVLRLRSMFEVFAAQIAEDDG